MALSVVINLDDLLFTAYNLGFTSDGTEPCLTKTELRTKLLANVPLLGCPALTTVTEEKTDTKATTEKKPREIKIKAEKPVAEFCCARAFREKEHIENGKVKKMSDDEANEFGGRCKFKQSGKFAFCKLHIEKQPYGVWGGEYSGKLKSLIEKPKDKTKNKPKKSKTVKSKHPIQEDDSDYSDDSGEDSPDEQVEGWWWIEIDNKNYKIDAEGNVYNPTTKEKIGQYNSKTKKWISRISVSE